MPRIFFLFFVVITTFYSGFSQPKSATNAKTEFTILFIGNSLTYTNNLPGLVEKYASSKGINVVTKMVAFPNYAIEDHWKDGQVQQLISGKTYDFVVIQQGPSSQSDGRKMLIEYGKKYNDLCELNDAKLCYFMVWPSLNYYYTFDDVIKNHKDAATINNSILLPVGEFWKTYIDKSEDIGYYGEDGFHPSVKGSQLAAEVIVEHLFKE